MIHSPRMLELPTTFGKYYLTERLAVGGMAEIFLALQRSYIDGITAGSVKE